jgi:hypothetical protein
MSLPFVLTAFMLAAPTHAHAATLDTAKIEQLAGAKGRMNAAEGVFKVSVPRSDLSVSVGGVKLTPPSGLTSWAAFTPAGEGVMVMGDMVLTEDQVNPVISVALDNGLEVTALHNHFPGESPRLMFMHIGGTGPSMLAGAVGKVFAAVRSPGAPILPPTWTPRAALDGDAIASALGHKGDMAGGVYKVTIGRTTGMHGHTVGGTMGSTPGRRSPAPTPRRSSTATSPCSRRSSSRCSRRSDTPTSDRGHPPACRASRRASCSCTTGVSGLPYRSRADCARARPDET